VKCDLYQYENKAQINAGIHSLNLLGENNHKGVRKPSRNDYLSIDGAIVGMLIFKKSQKS
jgi:hypothetical protein